MFICIKDKKEEISDGSSCLDLAKKLNLTAPGQALAANINGINHDLTQTLNDGDIVKLLNFDSTEGKEVFWHTSAHVLAQAVLRLWPDAKATIGPAIENGFYYDFANLSISEADFEKIEKECKKVIEQNYKPQRKEISKKEALKLFDNNPYKKELIEGIEGTISTYSQGEFQDLCRGPHLPNVGKIKAFKLLKTSGAYWRADQTKEMLTRIYGISFPDKSLLVEYVRMVEEAKKRDHKLLGQKLDLFSIKEEAIGMPFIHPKGIIIWNNLLNFLRECLEEKRYVEIKTPILLAKELWERSGHWFHYKQNMYISSIDEKEYAIKPMNCPGCILFYKSTIHSYRELPLRVGEIGLVHRHELSGALNGLFRVRSFHQDDAHIFMLPSQIKSEILEILSLADKIYSTFGLSFKLELSTRPEKSKTIGTDEDWERATEGLKSALADWKMDYQIKEGEGAFYGPKIDVHIRDAIGRFWQCGTIQLDMSFPEKFDLTYVDNTGEHKRPIMIHRTIFGSIERFFGILIEHFAGNFPLWLSPLGVRLIPVAERHNEYAFSLAERIKKIVPCDVDDSNESVSKKIRNAELLKINYMLTVGDKEIENKTVSVRTRNNVVHGETSLDSFLKEIETEKREKSLTSSYKGVK